MWKVILSTTSVVVPVTVTTLDVFGYVAKVEGASMQPCLNPHDKYTNVDYVFLNRWQARHFKFQRGEVVSLSSPNNPDQKIIKRIIALEGDTVKTLSYKKRHMKVPEGHIWVEGDNHKQSMDSNFFGPVAMGLITSKASHIVWPPSRWQRMPQHTVPQRINPTSSDGPGPDIYGKEEGETV